MTPKPSKTRNAMVLQPWLRSRAWAMLLILLAWQGPIPVCHAHATLKASKLPSPELASHLITDHSLAEISADDFIDWHWHWIMPDELLTKHSESSTNPTSDEQSSLSELRPIMQIESPALEQGTTVCFLEVVSDYVDIWHRQSLRRQDLPTSFLMTFASDLSLPERLSVYRC